MCACVCLFIIHCLRCARKHRIITAHAVVFLFLLFFLSFFLTGRILCSLLVRGIKRDRLETFKTQCAELAQFALHFFGNLTYGQKIRVLNSSPTPCLRETSSRLAANAVTASPYLADNG